jgi:hypothetical protein
MCGVKLLIKMSVERLSSVCSAFPAVMRRSEKEKNDYLMVQFVKLQNGESDRQHFLKAIGFKFSARTDL